jgi:hypothetical protein
MYVLYNTMTTWLIILGTYEIINNIVYQRICID